MTTIAYKDGCLAADTKITFGDARARHETKIIEFAKGKFLAYCGACEEALAVIEWLKSKDKRKRKPSIDNFACVIYSKRELITMEGGLMAKKHNLSECFAIGNGWQWAMAAMDHGATAKEAVEYAATRDIYTGYTQDCPVTVIQL